MLPIDLYTVIEAIGRQEERAESSFFETGVFYPLLSHYNSRRSGVSKMLNEPLVLFCQRLPPQPFFQAHELLVADDQMVYELYI